MRASWRPATSGQPLRGNRLGLGGVALCKDKLRGAEPSTLEAFRREVLKLFANIWRSPQKRFQNTIDNRFRVVGIHDLTKHAATDRFPAGVRGAGNDRHTARKRLEVHDSKSFASARHHEHVRQPKMIRLL